MPLRPIDPSRIDQVQPIPFYPFYLSAAGVEYQTMPWFSVQLIRRDELADARDEWCGMIGVSTEEYDEGENDSGRVLSRVARRRHAVNAAASELTELFLEACMCNVGVGFHIVS